ncbi:MAG: nucleotidyl transferase AbiEii/AbiGii toxin family protein [Planctomycetota bacterium]
MPESGPFEKTLSRLAAAFDRDSIPYMLVGGLAVLVHGIPRLTRDIDVTVLLDPSGVARLIAALGREFGVLVADPESFAAETRVLPMEGPDGTRVDVIFAGLPFEEAAIGRARPERLGAVEVRVCTAEDLILHKIVSERAKDREDVAGILRTRGADLDLAELDRTIEALAADLEHPEMLEAWRRLRAGA